MAIYAFAPDLKIIHEIDRISCIKIPSNQTQANVSTVHMHCPVILDNVGTSILFSLISIFSIILNLAALIMTIVKTQLSKYSFSRFHKLFCMALI